MVGDVVDAFEAPKAASQVVGAGELDVLKALIDGGTAFVRNFGNILLVMLMCVVVYVVSICTLLGWLIALPVLAWGLCAFVLECVDGTGWVGSLYPPDGQFWSVGGRMWLLGILYIPFALLNVAPQLTWNYLAHGTVWLLTPDPLENVVVGMVGSLLLAPLWCRLWFVPYFLVDRNGDVFSSVKASWQQSRPVWGRLMVLWLAVTVLLAPFTLATVGLQWLIPLPNRQAIDLQIDSMTIMAAFWGVILVFYMVLFGIQMVFAAAYRQVVGPRPE